MPFAPLSFPLVARLRRNHALEHATIHVLSQRYQDLNVVGRSTLNGFILYGDLPTEGVLLAAQHALQRLQAGRRDLAVHPSCGTNLAASGILSGLGTFAALSSRRKEGWKDWLSRLPLVLLVATTGVILGQRLGMVLQAHLTTDPNVDQVQIAGVVREERGPLIAHQVKVKG
ncbi:MAG: DUF6391 domain-containing protein [Anaerolineae bacterium]|jgi:hypothetical protein